MDVFIEPVLPRPPLIIFGENELADGLLKLGEFVGLNPLAFQGDDTAVDPSRIISAEDFATYPGLSEGFIVIATQGRGDKAALHDALDSPCPHIFFVSSRKKAAYWRDALASDGVTQEQFKRLNAPGGLAIGAQGPNEIAIAILAAIIQIRRASPQPVTGKG
jgi:xanthine dehydrogenase accessory factor